MIAPLKFKINAVKFGSDCPLKDLGFVPTEKCTLEDVNAAFVRDALLISKVAMSRPRSRFVSDTTLLNQSSNENDQICKVAPIVKITGSASGFESMTGDFFSVINEDTINKFLRQL